MKRCHECGRGFGLIRYRWGLHQFCTRLCMQRYKSRFLERGRDWWLSSAEAQPNMLVIVFAIAAVTSAAAFGLSLAI